MAEILLVHQCLGCRLIRYSASIVDCMLEGLVSMDRKTRTILAVNGYLHTKRNVARLYILRKEGVRVDWYWGVLEGEKIVSWLPERYQGEGICWRRESSGLPEKKGRGESQEREARHGEFATKTSDVAGEESCGCLRNGVVKDGKRRQSNPKQCKGLVRRLSLPDIFWSTQLSAINSCCSHFAECAVPLSCWMQLRNEKTKKNTRVLERIAQ